MHVQKHCPRGPWGNTGNELVSKLVGTHKQDTLQAVQCGLPSLVSFPRVSRTNNLVLGFRETASQFQKVLLSRTPVHTSQDCGPHREVSVWRVQGPGHLLPPALWVSPAARDHGLSRRNAEHSPQLGKVHRSFPSGREREEFPEKVLKNKDHNTVSPLLCFSRCRGLGLFSLVVAKSLFSFSNHNFMFFSQSSPTLTRPFIWRGSVQEGPNTFTEKHFYTT